VETSEAPQSSPSGERPTQKLETVTQEPTAGDRQDPGPPSQESLTDDDFSFDPDQAAWPARGRAPEKEAQGFSTHELDFLKED